MGEEWRLLIELDAEGALVPFADELVSELGAELGLHRAGNALVAYADDAEGAGAAERRLRRELGKRGLAHLRPVTERWDHDRQEWTGEQNAADPQPDGEATGPAPAAESVTVVASLSHHRETKRLAAQLRDEGYEVSTTRHGVRVSTASESAAQSLAAEIGVRAPEARIEIESA